jgi:serine protease Do
MHKKENYESSEEIRDAMWKNAECSQDIFGEIKFRKNNKKNHFKIFVKVFSYILIASLSGGITAHYVTYKEKIPKNPSEAINQGALEINNFTGIYDSSVAAVAQKVTPTVVGISNKPEAIWNTPEGSGSGIIIKTNGFIITNYHVIEGETEIKVKLSNDNVLKAVIIGVDARSDLAIIKVEANNLPIAKFGDSSKVKVGDLAVAIGNPMGVQFSGTVTAGIISALNRNISIIDKKTGEQNMYKVIQTDAAINPGNSGGALCNIYGEVIGISSLKINSASEAYGTGFAINSNEAAQIIDDLITYGKVIRPALGIYGGGTQISVGDEGVEGIYVQEVTKGSGADLAGIMPTDIIIEIDDMTTKNMQDLSGILEKYEVGDKLSCKVWRNGKIKKLSIILSEL